MLTREKGKNACLEEKKSCAQRFADVADLDNRCATCNEDHCNSVELIAEQHVAVHKLDAEDGF